jgi:hypothetical protein
MELVVCPVARYMVTLMICRAEAVNLIGSEKATAPLGTVKLGLPEKVTCWRVDGWMLLLPEVPFPGSATVTAVMGRSDAPKVLVNCSRIVDTFCVR